LNLNRISVNLLRSWSNCNLNLRFSDLSWLSWSKKLSLRLSWCHRLCLKDHVMLLNSKSGIIFTIISLLSCLLCLCHNSIHILTLELGLLHISQQFLIKNTIYLIWCPCCVRICSNLSNGLSLNDRLSTLHWKHSH
jgi:hypothetical protein